MKGASLIAVACLACAVQAQAQQTRIVLKPVAVGDSRIAGFVLPPPTDATGYVLEIHDASVNPPRFLDRRPLGTIDAKTGAFTVELGGGLRVEPRQRITVSNESAKVSPATTTMPLAPPVLRGRIYDGARIVEGQMLDRTTVTAVRVRVSRSSLENQAGESPYEQMKTTREIDADGAFAITLAHPLIAGQVVTAEALTTGTETSVKSYPVTVTDPGSWGRARAYFSGGVVFSKENGDFSKQDLMVAFAMDKSWLQAADYTLEADKAVRQSLAGDPKARSSGRFTFRQLNSLFDTRLTALPVVPSDEATPFVDSRKSLLIQVGIYAPVYGPQTSWVHDGAVNALFIAPLVRGGIQTITDEPEEGAEADDVFNSTSFGFGIGHHKLSGTSNQTPELLSYLHVSWGKSEAFELIRDGQTVRPVRMFVEGRLKIPETAMQVGFDANLGDGPDDIRFLFGTRFDIGELFKRLRPFD